MSLPDFIGRCLVADGAAHIVTMFQEAVEYVRSNETGSTSQEDQFI